MNENIYYVQTSIEDLYKSEFDEVVSEYNKQQKRSDRKINDYYKKILNDDKTEHQREIIIALGTKEDNSDPGVLENKKEVLDKYVRGFQKRNPNLKVYNAVMHNDEKNPHLHINYVPIASYTKGLKKRVAQSRALQQQGFRFENWRENETKIIENLMNESGMERHIIGTHSYKTPKQYKDFQEEVKILEKESNEFKNQLDKAIERFDDYNALQLVDIDEIPVKFAPLSNSKLLIDVEYYNEIKMNYKAIQSLALSNQKESYEIIENARFDRFENKKLKKEIEDMKQKDFSNNLRSYDLENREHKVEIQEKNLNKEILELKNQRENLEKNLKEKYEINLENHIKEFEEIKQKYLEINYNFKKYIDKLEIQNQEKDKLLNKYNVYEQEKKKSNLITRSKGMEL